MSKKPTTAQMRKELEAIRNMTPEEKEENRQKLLSPSQIKEVLYHATPKNFKKFKPGGDDIKKSGHGIWLSMVAERQPAMHNISGRGDDLFKHGTNVMPVHVQSRTPLVLDSQEMDDWARNAFAGGSGNFPYMMPKEWADAVQAEGYDSIYNPRSKEVVMFDPTKIKSAIGNRGTYDTTRADITKAGGGSIDQMRYELLSRGGKTHMPNELREKGRQKFLKPSKEKRVMYHGTTGDFNEFHPGTAYVSPDPKFASDWSGSPEGQEGANVMPVHVQVKNPFDYENPRHVKRLESHLNKVPGLKDELNAYDYENIKDFIKAIPFGSHHELEIPEIQKAIKDLGHDAFYVNEGHGNMAKNLGIYDPRKIKSSIGNRGTYDVNEHDITKANGGKVSTEQMRHELHEKALQKYLAESQVKHRVYHGTYDDFSVPKTSHGDDEYHKFGIHVGTADQANKRIKDISGPGDFSRTVDKAPNVMPLHINTKNPLRLDENRLGRWGVNDILGAMMEKADKGELESIPKHHVDEYFNDEFNMDKALNKNVSRLWSDDFEWAPGEKSKALKAYLHKLGHDSIVYKNEHEGEGDSYILLHPHQLKSATGNSGAYDPKEKDITKAKGGIVSMLRKHGRPVDSDLDAMRKMSNGHRVFVAHEQDEAPREIKSISEMHGYTPDQIYTVDPKHFAKGGKVKEPKSTVKAYKLFRVHPSHPGKLFPLFVDANTPVEMNKWVEAKEGEMANGKVKSKIGALAYRPGWHAGDLPIATHIGEKSDPSLTAPDTRPANHVWAEVEMPNDVDWQSIANERGMNEQGKIVPVKAHITDQIPLGGHYRYKTNPNMTGNWLIGGAMKVNKVLTDKQVEKINKAAGLADLPRAKPFNRKMFGFAHGGLIAPEEWVAEEHVHHEPNTRVTHAHHLDIEERPL